MTSHHMHNEFVFVFQSIAKKRTFGQKDCTIWKTREVRERSGVFIVHGLASQNTCKYFICARDISLHVHVKACA